MKKMDNITKHNIDLKLTLANLKKADEGIERMVISFAEIKSRTT